MQFVIVLSPIITYATFHSEEMMQQPPKHGSIKIYVVKIDRFSLLHMFLMCVHIMEKNEDLLISVVYAFQSCTNFSIEI